MNRAFDITILIPAKDEERRLSPFLEETINFSRHFTGRVEIIVINDGSQDKTAELVYSFQKHYADLILINLPTNRGKGYALKRGMFSARGKIIAFLDADGSTPVEEVGRHLPEFQAKADIVIGSRVLKSAGTKVEMLPHRKWIGSVFNSIVHAFLIQDVKDTQCGFKMFKREIVRGLFEKIQLDGFGVDLEILYVAKKMGLNIKEVAVNWHHVSGSKVSLVKDSWRMLVNIFQIRSWHA